ncbi:MAG: transcriptional regulator [Rhodospirillales bacterium 69-11]|nr:AbrB/MazE/SpoVT family DNA-binding domain-containing protein [Rhodospirillales bacterium]MBN8899451.1 AbrB/MazE/SpoVT family DNA-binding domain-containing protein [Rhodospirillales bacterium]MBN8907302.1 AbrB/MazE/SpoVT family DNA-binding domain-containing protein [Rhodospirillales bacterium]MBN8925756.1 AbrB/MazE/SpoVT family DNA-binding domain-containing protein [Rhodospirillales bacterium]OJW25195.1 MAG: transcriptional regulator [Rhodospirillales bacterium 69-11]
MTTLTVTAKGQVTLRKDVLRHLGIGPGDKISVVKLPNGRLEVSKLAGTGRIADVFDMFAPNRARTLSLDDIERIAAEGWAGSR